MFALSFVPKIGTNNMSQQTIRLYHWNLNFSNRGLNYDIQQFPKRNFLKDLKRLNKIVPQHPDVYEETTNEGSDCQKL